ncbi:linear amide C-N hydrolase [Thalassospira lucentensis]|uniref:linear amide C-N hydrolase n=1 Tax=Thalassospira lucentensis TaxID=168935 RepID=UPI00142DFA7D|nr:linear amide C-N hydrolase [Thalassospira lucentensis]NIZ03725.1 linear amide C-N hydrolase [Thalassospira lucentensis]
MCTDFQVNVPKQGYINGRSMEFGMELESKFFFRKAGHIYDQKIWGENFGLSWQGKYGFVGMNAFNLPLVVDGMNTQGLSTGNLWLPGTQYQTITDPQKGLNIDNFSAWVLSNFASCEEVKSALEANQVQVGAPKFLQNLLPLHYPIHDDQGNSIVIEFIQGEIKIYDNPVGVLTNQPPFPDQLSNLRNYVDLTPWNNETATFNGFEVAQTGNGSGLLHLPGDPTPPSRFVRATTLSSFSEPVDTLDQGVNLALHILNAVDIPRGLIRNKGKNGTEMDYTQWAVIKDMTRRVYYARLYASLNVQSIDISALESSNELDALDGKQVAFPLSPIPEINSELSELATNPLNLADVA